MAPIVDRAQRLLAFEPPLPTADAVRAFRDEALRMMRSGDGAPGCCGAGGVKPPRVPELRGVLPEPAVGAMDVRDALVYARSVRLAGLRDVLCREAAAIAQKSWNDQMRRMRFLECPVPSDGVGALPRDAATPNPLRRDP